MSNDDLIRRINEYTPPPGPQVYDWETGDWVHISEEIEKLLEELLGD